MGDNDHGGLLLRQTPDDLEHLAGELRVQGGGGLIKAEDVRGQGQGPGDGDPLLLAAGELVGVVSRPLCQPHFGQQRAPLRLDLLQDRLFVLLEIGPLLSQKLLGQGDIFQRRVLGEQVEGLEHHAKVETLFADLALPLGCGVARVKEDLVPDQDPAPVGGLQKV